MKYYVYENWTAKNRATIHRGDCGFCNNGQGCHANPLRNKNGKWHGPFKTLQLARSTAKGTGRKVHPCGCI